jgi:hypothetical protein
MLSYDVLVAGGGSAGLGAAVAAARSGARTLLVERQGVLGGMATSALVHSICGLYVLSDTADATFANPGFASEFARRLIHGGGAVGPVRMGRLDVLPHQPGAFALLCDRIVSEAPELELRLHSEVTSVEAGREVRAVEIACRGRRELVAARAVVDASGDGTLAVLAGAEFEQEPADRLQRPAFIFALQGVAAAPLAEAGRLKVMHRIATAARQGRLDPGLRGTSLRGSGRPGEMMVTVDLEGPPSGPYDPLDPICLTALEIEGRRLAVGLADFLRCDVGGFSASSISALPARVGIRESRRIVGERRIETAAVLAGAQPDDGVALGTWPIELREHATGPRLRFPDSGRPYAIPLGALRARGRRNLFVAGRCIAASHEAQASLRVIGTCLATGEAAGLAAALLAARPSGADVDAAEVVAARTRVMLPFSDRAARAA